MPFHIENTCIFNTIALTLEIKVSLQGVKYINLDGRYHWVIGRGKEVRIRKWLRNKLPSGEALNQHPRWQWLGKYLSHHPNLMHFNRHSVPMAVAVGLLVAFLPVPGQTVLAALLAFYLRVNIVLAIVATWVSNPITFVPINLAIYYIGDVLIGESHKARPLTHFHFDWLHWQRSLAGMGQWLMQQGEAYLLGLLVLSIVFALFAYVLIKLLWRFSIVWHLYQRKRKRRQH